MNKPHGKKTRNKIIPTEKEFNEVIEMKNENIPSQKIRHSPRQNKIRRASIEPYSDIIEVGNVDVEPLKIEKIRKTRTVKPRNILDL